MKTTKTKILAPLLLAFGPALVAGYTGCKKDEPPPPLPSAAPEEAPAPTAPLELAPEIPLPSASASEEAPKAKGGGSSSSLKKCCGALRQNAENAPEPNKTYMLQAAGVCDMAAGAGQASGSALGPISAALRGAGLPTACK